jgi:CBS domain-containing protein
MRVAQLMTRDVRSVASDQSLSAAAQLMWECDCGAIPVREAGGAKVIGMVTDRDICMATWSKGLAPAHIPVAEAMSSRLVPCSPNDTIATAESMMRANKIRRVPVVDADGGLVGILSLADIAQSVGKRRFLGDPDLAAEPFAQTIAAICEERPSSTGQARV